ncbi:hypothetical protein AAC691_11215 [Nguyenibacter vanlangensis]|uniref:Uncharacterized protein n=1 Tax=Nguyenibacter vanlangensis TaxID=1216886 RepID=A0ABZ3CZI5_9PROT
MLTRTIVHASDIQDRDGGVLPMVEFSARLPSCRTINGKIVKRSDIGKFVVLPTLDCPAHDHMAQSMPRLGKD